MCSPKFLLMFVDTDFDHRHDFITINEVSVNGYGEMCYEEPAVRIQLYQSLYPMIVELHDSNFYDMNQMALAITMENANSSLLVRNCTFEYVGDKIGNLDQVIYGESTTNHMSVGFEKCKFHYNIASIILEIKLIYYDTWCVQPTKIRLENCNFVNNSGNLLKLLNEEFDCKVNVFFKENINLINNKANSAIYLGNMVVHMNGTLFVSDNIVKFCVMEFDFCNIVWTKMITFDSNICNDVIYLKSFDLPYVKVIEHVNVTFTNNTYHQIIFFDSIMNGVFPYCFFQYIALYITCF